MEIGLLVMTAGAVWTDLKEQKIKNKWIGPWTLAGIALGGYQGGAGGLVSSLGGMMLPVFLLWWAFCLKKMGAGDIKLFCAAGSFLGIGRILECMMTAMVFGAIFIGISKTAGRKKKTIRLSLPVFCSVLCGIGGIY